MPEPLDPVTKKDLDDAITMIMAHTHDQGRQSVAGWLTTAIVLTIAFLLGGVWGVLIAFVVLRIIQFFHPSKKYLAAIKAKYLKVNPFDSGSPKM